MDSIALICTAVLGLLVFGLGFAVSAVRFQENSLAGYAADPSNRLHKVVRAHANTAEYAPLLAVLFLYLGSRDPAATTQWLMIGATVCRVLVVVGILAWPTLARPNPLRFLGALGTYLLGGALSVILVTGA
jgi:uncharacterized membrane protein YecN with MAPEG domain